MLSLLCFFTKQKIAVNSKELTATFQYILILLYDPIFVNQIICPGDTQIVFPILSLKE